MQFLYADGTDAHFMDSESFEQIDDPRGVARRRRCSGCKPNDEVDLLSIDGQPSDIQLPSAVDLEVTRDRARPRGDTASGGGTSRRRSRPARWSRSRCSSNIGDRCASTRAPATTSRGRRRAGDRGPTQRPAPRAVFALYQHDLTGRPLDDTARARRAPFTRALAQAAADHQRGARRADRPPRRGLGARADRAAGALDPARRPARDAARRRGAGRGADPARGRDRRGGRDREGLLRLRGAGLRQRHPRRRPARACGRMPRAA